MIYFLGSFRWNQAQDVQFHPSCGWRAHVPRCSGVSASPHHKQDAALVQKAGRQRGNSHQAKGTTDVPPILIEQRRQIDVRWKNICQCASVLGHGPSAHILEGGSSAGMPGHHSGDVDPPEGMAALWCSNAAWESCFCLVKLNWFLPSDRHILGQTQCSGIINI